MMIVTMLAMLVYAELVVGNVTGVRRACLTIWTFWTYIGVIKTTSEYVYASLIINMPV